MNTLKRIIYIVLQSPIPEARTAITLEVLDVILRTSGTSVWGPQNNNFSYIQFASWAIDPTDDTKFLLTVIVPTNSSTDKSIWIEEVILCDNNRDPKRLQVFMDESIKKGTTYANVTLKEEIYFVLS